MKRKYLEVTVMSDEFVNSYTFSIGGMQFTENAAEGKTFVIIKVHFHQIGDDPQYIGPTDFWLIDHNNYKYDCDYRTYSLDGGLTSTTLYKNLNAEGKILYEIPIEANGLKVQYNFATFWDSPKIIEWIIL
ncbi:MAG: DUF4352 domain-containing protein [Candidatus Thermoplasmatota archaeon]|nr:DUF4352 domain-containing protein [Candidatus Thermoplasmatota archaeon]